MVAVNCRQDELRVSGRSLYRWQPEAFYAEIEAAGHLPECGAVAAVWLQGNVEST